MMRVNNVFVSNIKEMHVTVDVKSEDSVVSMPLADVIDAFVDAKREFETALSALCMHERSVEAARKRAEARNLDLERLVERQVFPQSAAAWASANAKLERSLGLSRGPDAYRDAGNALPTGSIFETRGPAPTPDASEPWDFELRRGMVVQLGCIDGQHPPLPPNQPLVVIDITDDRTMAAPAYGATERWVPNDGRIRPWQ
jgi:hypothetical protein